MKRTLILFLLITSSYSQAYTNQKIAKSSLIGKMIKRGSKRIVFQCIDITDSTKPLTTLNCNKVRAISAKKSLNGLSLLSESEEFFIDDIKNKLIKLQEEIIYQETKALSEVKDEIENQKYYISYLGNSEWSLKNPIAVSQLIFNSISLPFDAGSFIAWAGISFLVGIPLDIATLPLKALGDIRSIKLKNNLRKIEKSFNGDRKAISVNKETFNKIKIAFRIY